MEEDKALAQQQQQQQQFLILQQQKQQHQQKQQQGTSRFPSNIDAHLGPPVLHRPINPQQQQSPNPNPSPSPNPNINPIPNQQQQQNPSSNSQQQQQQQMQQQKAGRHPANQTELQMSYQDAWRVCHPDFNRPFSSLEDVCHRLLPYHVVADYEAEEDDRILDSDMTGQMLSRSQQWDHNIVAKVAEFTATFEKQTFAFNVISRKRALGEFRLEERLMIEQALVQEERRSMFEVRAEMELRERAGREAHEGKLQWRPWFRRSGLMQRRWGEPQYK